MVLLLPKLVAVESVILCNQLLFYLDLVGAFVVPLLTVYLMGEGRGVPTNYLHVRLDPLAIDYWAGGSNFDLVVGRAADGDTHALCRD